MLTKRIIPCLDIKNGRTVKGVNFVDLIDAGNPVELAKKYSETGADELVFLDISATEERRSTLLNLVREVAEAINIPFTVGGGINSVEDVENLLKNGADKVSINSSAVKNPDLINQLAQKFGLKIISIKDLIDYRLTSDSLIEELVRVNMPTKYGQFELVAFKERLSGAEHLALIKGSWEKDEPVLTRVHSSCFTGDILGSLRCDCGDQLHKAMRMVDAAGAGVILYMNQEGRGIGLINKLRAYQLQEQGMDTVEANIKLGFGMDERDYGVGAQILRSLGITKLKLMSNNPRKRAGLKGYGLEIVATVPIEVAPNPHNEKYLTTKRDKLGHSILGE
jgi:GTP cyclohydrolase II